MDSMERKIISLIDQNREQIMDFGEDIYRHPEPGFQEERTAAKVAEFFGALGLNIRAGLARTGVRGDWMEQDGPHITIVGEMDAIGCAAHPMADSVTHVAHACGHHAQLAAMIGAALALTNEEVKASLSGSVSFFAVPAEEYVDYEKRKKLKAEGIGFPSSGKAELIRLGEFDDTDLIMTTHLHMIPTKEDVYLGNPPCNGFQAKMITIHGKPAHAAIAPWKGVNALNIATAALNLVGLQRETYPEEEHVRVHHLIRKGGMVINTVPEEVLVESKVRASSLEGLQDVRRKVDRAFEGAAYALGGTISGEPIVGYLPILPRMADPALIHSAQLLGVSSRLVEKGDFNNACTDVGDLSHLFPVVNFTFGGFEGNLHGEDFRITDPEKAYILPAKMLALTVYGLLKGNGAQAKEIISNFHPVFDKEKYCDYIRNH